MREEQKHADQLDKFDAMFGKRKMDLLEGRVKKLELDLSELKAYVKKAESDTSGL